MWNYQNSTPNFPQTSLEIDPKCVFEKNSEFFESEFSVSHCTMKQAKYKVSVWNFCFILQARAEIL